MTTITFSSTNFKPSVCVFFCLAYWQTICNLHNLIFGLGNDGNLHATLFQRVQFVRLLCTNLAVTEGGLHTIICFTPAIYFLASRHTVYLLFYFKILI